MITANSWALFQIANNYDQPNNDLKCWWDHKPSMEEVGKAIGCGFPAQNDEQTLAVVHIWNGIDARLEETDYRLQELKSGEVLE